MQVLLSLLLVALFVSSASAADSPAEPPFLDLRLPEGFKAEVLVSGLTDARAMALSDNNTLFVGSFRKGRVYAVTDVFSEAPQIYTIADGRRMPSGVAFHDGDLYVGEITQVVKYEDIEDKLANPGEPVVVVGDLSKKMLHGWKHIQIGPDDKLYVPQGSPCNVCDMPEFGTITRYELDGSAPDVVARGVRNVVGMAWHPQTSELWFTDNGRDRMGDDIPPDELNRLVDEGSHFGFPFCHGGTIVEPDPKLAALGSCADAVAPVQQLGPHVAALQLRFYTGDMFPAEYRNQIFIAEHGSWDRSEKIGYRIMLVRLDGNKVVSYEPFAEGWLDADGDTVHGRPVDVLMAPDGSLLVSDDSQGLVYRISYSAND
jgi:glucose/arabinose dehydrogenase